MSAKYISKVVENAAKYIALKKDEFSPSIRERIDRGQLRLQEADYSHYVSFSVLSDTIDLIKPNHKTGPGWSDFVDGKVENAIAYIDTFKILYNETTDQYQGFHTLNYVEPAIFVDPVLEIYKNDKLFFRYVTGFAIEQRLRENDVDTMWGFNFRRPLILTPDDKLQVVLKFPEEITYTPTAPNLVWFNLIFSGAHAKLR